MSDIGDDPSWCELLAVVAMSRRFDPRLGDLAAAALAAGSDSDDIVILASAGPAYPGDERELLAACDRLALQECSVRGPEDAFEWRRASLIASFRESNTDEVFAIAREVRALFYDGIDSFEGENELTDRLLPVLGLLAEAERTPEHAERYAERLKGVSD